MTQEPIIQVSNHVLTRTVTIQENRSLDVEGRLILFPKYMKKLMDLGKQVIITGDKIGDRKAVSVLMNSIMEIEDNAFCDVLVFGLANKTWLAINIEGDVDLTITRSGYDSYKYYPELLELSKFDTNFEIYTNMLINYVRIYSSASVVIK